jgi:hypothetical protein
MIAALEAEEDVRLARPTAREREQLRRRATKLLIGWAQAR